MTGYMLRDQPAIFDASPPKPKRFDEDRLIDNRTASDELKRADKFSHTESFVFRPPKNRQILFVPLTKWDEIRSKLERESSWVTSLFWTIGGITGGGAASFTVGFLSLDATAAPITILRAGAFALACLTAVFFILAAHRGYHSTAKNVAEQMKMLQDEFRVAERSS